MNYKKPRMILDILTIKVVLIPMKQVIALLLLSFLTLQINAQELDTSPKSLLWEVKGKDIKEPSYVFGTVHMIPQNLFFFPKVYEEKLKASKKVVMEIDLSNMMASMFQMMTAAKMLGDTTLKDLYTDEEYTLVKSKILNSLGQEELGGMGDFIWGMMESWKPMLLSSLITESSIEDTSATTSYEMELMTMAEAYKKEIGGLEDIAFQASIFDSIPYQLQADMLYEGLTVEVSDADTSSGINLLYEKYIEQDLDALYTLSTAELGEMARFKELLLDKRNIAWIPKMEEMMKEEPCFFAVGAGHLAGEKGVLNLLAEAGYSVTPVFMKTEKKSKKQKKK